MEKGYINVDENEINDITSYLGKNQAHLGDLGNTSKNTFQSLTKTNLFGGGVQKITNQVSSVSRTIGRVNQIIKNQTSEMMMLDDRLSKKAEQINIPMDFVRNNSVRNHIFDGIVLNKKDGKQVSDDNHLNQNELEMTSTVITNNLKDITTEERDFSNIKLKEYQEKNTMLENINNGQITQTNKLNFMEDGIVNQMLKSNIATGDGQVTSTVNTENFMKKDVILEDLDIYEKNIVDEYFYDDFFDNDNY